MSTRVRAACLALCLTLVSTGSGCLFQGYGTAELYDRLTTGEGDADGDPQQRGVGRGQKVAALRMGCEHRRRSTTQGQRLSDEVDRRVLAHGLGEDRGDGFRTVHVCVSRAVWMWFRMKNSPAL